MKGTRWPLVAYKLVILTLFHFCAISTHQHYLIIHREELHTLKQLLNGLTYTRKSSQLQNLKSWKLKCSINKTLKNPTTTAKVPNQDLLINILQGWNTNRHLDQHTVQGRYESVLKNWRCLNTYCDFTRPSENSFILILT